MTHYDGLRLCSAVNVSPCDTDYLYVLALAVLKLTNDI